jgi:hypothetical protein
MEIIWDGASYHIPASAPGSASARARAAMFGTSPKISARRIHHHRPRIDRNAGGKHGLCGIGILAVQLGERPLDRERRPHRRLSPSLFGRPAGT